MKDIFTDLYNKVLGFFRRNEKEESESAKDVACNRLKVVLMQDRTNLTPELMDRMRKELIELLSKYVEMDKEALELGFEQEGNQMALMLSIPVVRAREEAEIEATLAEEDALKEAQNADKEAEEEDKTSEETEENKEETSEEEDDSNSEDEVQEEDNETNSEEEEETLPEENEEKETKKLKK